MASSSFTDGMHALMETFPDVDDTDRTSILHWAAENGNVDEIANYLENTDISAVNEVDISGRTPLQVAIRSGHWKVAELLLQKGADQTIKRLPGGNTALHMVTNAQLAALLLEYGGDVNATNENGMTPLHKAVYEASSELINFLIKNSANVNAKSHIGMTPLHSAMRGQKLNLDIVSCLIEAGANVNETDFTERTPLHLYCHGIMTTERLSFLITKGCRLDKHDFNGNFPIHNLSYLYKEADIMDILRILCPNRDYVDLRNCKGRTPLMLAVSHRTPDLGTSLIKFGADVNLTDSFGRTAMHYVTDGESAESLINLMVLQGADINAEDYWGRSPLLHAIAMGETDRVRVLMKQGANINQQDKCGISPLHMARYNGMKKLFDELAEKGGDVNLEDKTGSTPLHVTATVKYMDIVNRLLRASADKDVEDNEGLTPAQVATIHGREELALLIESRHVTRKGFSNVGNTYLTKEEVDDVIRDKSCKRSIEDPSSYYSSILKSPVVGRGLDDAEAKEIQLVIEEQMQCIAIGIEEIDDRFKCVVLHVGSSSEGTKANCPDEFDFMFSLEKFSMHCTYEFEEGDNESYQFNTRDKFNTRDNCDNFEGKQTGNDQINDPFRHCKRGVSATGCVYVCIKDDTESETFRQIVGSSKVWPHTMNRLFSDLVERVVYGRGFPKHDRLIPIEVTRKSSIQYSWSGSKYKHLIIDIDLVPALTMPTWPPNVRINKALLTDDLSRISCMVVPKMINAFNILSWRCSFALVETAIIRKLRKEVRNAYITCKAMTTSGVLPSVNFLDDISDIESQRFKRLVKKILTERYPDDMDVFMFRSPQYLIPSYILKMSFLNLLEEKAIESGKTSVYDARLTIPDPKMEGQGLQHATKADRTYYGPAITMHTATASTEVDKELVKSVIQRSHTYLSERFVPSVFNKRQNVLNEDLLTEDVIEEAIVLFKLMMDIIDDKCE